MTCLTPNLSLPPFGFPLKIKQTIVLALEPSIVKRGLKYAIVVGTVLVGINHGDRIISGALTPYQMIQIGLTYSVPYIVSSLSSVQAIIAKEKADGSY